jgi:riboflavin synthase
VERRNGLIHYSIEFTPELLEGLQVGASVAVDGVCQTVVGFESNHVFFDLIQETLQITTFESLVKGQWVNIERSLRIGDELGGHLVSGHVYGKVQVSQIKSWENNRLIFMKFPAEWQKFIFKKGYITVHGVSLTVVDTNLRGEVSVSLIPETLRRTNLKYKKQGDWVNIEIDSQTQTIVETVGKLLTERFPTSVP